LRRLEFAERIREVISPTSMTPAVGQGALGLETRANDSTTADALSALDHHETHAAVDAERSMLRELRGGCLAPVGGWARVEGNRLVLMGVVCSMNGSQRIRIERESSLADAVALGAQVAQELNALGANRLLDDAREVQ
jgi:hydroxymethylbilane synthase